MGIEKNLIFKDVNQDSNLHDPAMCESHEQNHEWQHIPSKALRYRVNMTIATFIVSDILQS